MNFAQEQGMNAVEEALRGLAPGTGRLDRDAVIFAAGRASARRGGAAWPLALAALVVIALGVGFLAGGGTGNPGGVPPARPGMAERVEAPAVPQDETAAAFLAQAEAADVPEVSFTAPTGYLELRREVMENGADALPSPGTSEPPEPLHSLFNGIL